MVRVSFATKVWVGALVIALPACSLTDLDNLGPGATVASTGAGASGGQGIGGAASSPASSTQSSGPGGNTTAGYREAVLMDMPVAYWRLGEDGTLRAVDEIGAHTGNYSGTYVQGASGALPDDGNTAVEFPGTNGFVTFGDVLDLTELSIEAWIKIDAIANGAFHHVVCKRMADVNGEQGYGINVSPMFGINFAVARDSSYSGGAYMSPELDVWYHLVGTFDGLTAQLFVNGVSVDNVVKPVMMLDNPAPLLIGGYDRSGNGSFQGTIDEVAIYDTALSPNQVAAHYQAAGTR